MLLFSNPAHFDLLYLQEYIDRNRLLLHLSDNLLDRVYPSKEEIKNEDELVNEDKEVKLSEDPS